MPGRRVSTDVVVVALAWIILTVAFEAYVLATVEPSTASREAEIVDSAFWLLTVLGIPVFTFVLVVLIYSVFRFRVRAGVDQPGDGPPIRSHRAFVSAWVVITAALAVFVIFNPGYTGLAELAAEPEADLEVEVLAKQWDWSYTFLEQDVTVLEADELVLPVDTRVRFLITSEDVLHSFWIPAFRIKVDAVPGRITETLVTPTELGDFATDSEFRVQCAELCGTGHTRLRNRVRVVERAEFDAWLEEMRGAAG